MRISSFILSLFTCLTIIGQTNFDQRIVRTGTKIPVDTSFMEVVYSYKVYDDHYKLQQDFYDILEIGDDCSYYSCYGQYRVDSIIQADYPDGIKNIEYRELRSKTHPRADLSIIRNLKSGQMTCYDNILMDYYFYEEPIPQIKWTLLPESEEICGYKCYKAIGSFRGREWTAWYCDDIPQNNGPWKFGNLPGLILKVEDLKKDHIFEAIAVRKSSNPFGPKKKNRIKTDRLKFNEAKAEFKNHPELFMSGTELAPKDKNGNEIKSGNRMFFNPIEIN